MKTTIRGYLENPKLVTLRCALETIAATLVEERCILKEAYNNKDFGKIKISIEITREKSPCRSAK